MSELSKVRYSLSALELANSKAVKLKNDQLEAAFDSAASIGLHTAHKFAAMDAALIGPAAGPGATLAQNLQHWLPGVVNVLTTVRSADRLAGLTEAGEWWQDSVVIQTKRPTGQAEWYGDSSNIPYANYDHNYESRSIVNFELGFKVGRLEEAREAASGINMAVEKRASAALGLDIRRNRHAFFGYVGNGSRSFGLLNDPGLPTFTTAPSTYAAMTYDQLTAEISTQLNLIATQSGGNVDHLSNYVFALPLGYYSVLTKPNTMGKTVMEWLNENYPNVRIEMVPEFLSANGGANVAYYWAESVNDGSTDGGAALTQVVPAKLFNIGSEQRSKEYIEDFGSATAGVIVKRPYLFVRRTGV